MTTQTIRHHRTGQTIYEGRFATLRQALEQAARDQVRLDFADLPRVNLVNADLDGLRLRDARLCHANLMGANLSEADLDGADFSHAGLQNACLAESALRRCNFDGALFGATDLTGAALDRSVFSTLSALILDFSAARSMSGCRFDDPSGMSCPMSQPPLAVTGLACPVFLLDRHIKIGGWVGLHHQFPANLPHGAGHLQSFVDAYGDSLLRPLLSLGGQTGSAQNQRKAI